jgi:hypothetical protein
MSVGEKLNMSMLCDFYELTMGNGYFEAGLKDRVTYFDVFFRDVPDKGGFAVAAGLAQIIEYIEDLHFSEEDIQYLRDRNLFTENFLDYLKNFKFTGDLYAIPEGTPVFPREPLITVRAPAIQAQIIETFLLLAVNHQSLIATKANRIVAAPRGRTAPSPAHGPPISAGVRERPAPSPTSCSAFPPGEPWLMPGFRCSTASMRHSKPTAGSIPRTRRFWWIPTTPLDPVFRTPSGLSTRYCVPWAFKSAASALTPAIWRI